MGRAIKTNGRIVRTSSGEIEMLLAEAKRAMWAAHLAMGEALGNTDPVVYHRQMKAAQKFMIDAERKVDEAQALARNILNIAEVAAKRGEYQTE